MCLADTVRSAPIEPRKANGRFSYEEIAAPGPLGADRSDAPRLTATNCHNRFGSGPETLVARRLLKKNPVPHIAILSMRGSATVHLSVPVSSMALNALAEFPLGCVSTGCCRPWPKRRGSTRWATVQG